ncbi:MAG: enoyl-CoA hydratase/isomerase family protein [Deltaproteobacteria bacterium]|nr:enoyl-CoA hydratase/isomerase family protein [Deltaproteobacteria bacterium]MBW2137377.1 enoyl-CoA hydratase/isomerase family protein [Deltaproteobacteria bacterium]
MDKALKVDVTDRIAKLALNSPKSYNAFDQEMIEEVLEKLTEIARESSLLGVVITGEGKAFCAGGDLRWLTRSESSPGDALHALAARYHQAIVEIRRMPKPVIAAINGLAAGGGFSLALACDFRVMESSATLVQAYTSNGLSMDGGGTFTLPRLVGMAKALEIAAFDRPISSELALEWGLVTEVVPDGQAVDRAVALVKEINNRPLSSFSASKALFNDSFSMSFEAQLERERKYLTRCADHPNGMEGIRAFLEKRKPSFVQGS